MKLPQLARPKLTLTSRTSLSGSTRVSSNDVSSVLIRQPDLPQRSPYLVPLLGPSLPLVLPLLLLLLRPPLLHLHQRHRLLPLGLLVLPRRLPTERPPWSSMQVDSGI